MNKEFKMMLESLDSPLEYIPNQSTYYFTDKQVSILQQALSRSEVGEVDPIEEAHKRSKAYKYDKSKYPVMPSGKTPAPDVEELVNMLETYAETDLETLYNNKPDFVSRIRRAQGHLRQPEGEE